MIDFPEWLHEIELEVSPGDKKLLEHCYYAGYANGYKDSFNFGKLLEAKRKAFAASQTKREDD